MSASGFSMGSLDDGGGQISWATDIAAKDKITITYKLSVPKLQAGWPLRVPAAAVSYEINGSQKKLIGKSFEIKIS